MTPREILLQQHRKIEPRLDAVRREVLADLHRTESPRRSPSPAAARSWFGAGRWRFIALATAWLIVILLQVDLPDPIPALAHSDAALSTRQLTLNVRENRRQLFESLDLSTRAASGSDEPAPRSAVQPKLFNA